MPEGNSCRTAKLRSMESAELLELVAGILEVDAADVSLADHLEQHEWDSLSNLTFIAEIDERLGIAINADELARAKTVGDLQTLIASGMA